MKIIPLQALPSQSIDVLLANQNCTINVYQKSTGMFLDLYVDNTLTIGGVVCQDRNRIVRDLYLGFAGDLAFIDSQGTDDPVYTGLGGRFVLAYLEVSDLPAGVG